MSTPENTQILQISFKDSGAETARRGAQGFAQGYLEFKAIQAQTAIDETSATIQDQIDKVDLNIQAVDSEIEGFPTGITRADVGGIRARVVGSDPAGVAESADGS